MQLKLNYLFQVCVSRKAFNISDIKKIENAYKLKPTCINNVKLIRVVPSKIPFTS